jgi:hypothetical protein
MTVSFTKPVKGLAYCHTPTSAIDDCWAATGARRTYVLSVVDQGKGRPPTLLYESWRTGNPSENTFPAQYDTWLATVRFVK